MIARRTSRPLSTALAAAVLAGGLAAGSAAPALAAPAETSDGRTFAFFSYEEGVDGAHATFYTMHTPAQDVRVTMAPFTPADPTSQEAVAGETGPETVVESAYDPELERGTVDLLEQRRALGEAGTGHVVVGLHVDGQPRATLYLGPDADLSDDVPGELLHRFGPQEYSFEYRPTVGHVTLLAAPQSRMVYLQGNSTGAVPGGGTLTVAEQPEHGTLVELPGVADAAAGSSQRWPSTVYVADEGFTGTDQAVFTITDDITRETKTLVVTFSVGDERADDTVLEPQAGGLPYDESRVWAALDAQGDDAETPAPEAPAETPAPEAGPETGEHAVPDTVQTGEPQAWWLAALSALGLGGLAVARRRRTAR